VTTHKTLAAALIAAQQQFGDITKDKSVEVAGKTKEGRLFKYSYTYANLGSVLDAVMPALHENGLTLVQAMELQDGVPGIVTILMHDGSESRVQSFTPIYWADKTDTQKYGGAITYCRRYAIMALLCLAAEDDDGQEARKPAARPQTQIDEMQPAYSPLGPTPKREVDHLPDAKERGIPGSATEHQLKTIFAIARGDLGWADEDLKHDMWTLYGDPNDFEGFSRKSLSFEQATEYIRTLRAVATKRTVNMTTGEIR
jgi:hypothetical protein